MNIRTKQFQILTDIGLAWKLMTDVYNHEETNGPAAPFFEYAIISSWLDKDYLRLNRFWLDGDLPVAFVFYEQPVTSMFFVLRSGYDFLADEMIASGFYSDIDAVVPVPLHWTRRWSRGYNQAEVIGKVIASALGVPLRADILKRLRRTRTQTKLSIEGKTANVRGAFGVRKGSDINGLSHILLVDDVFTTGATLHSCLLALREEKSFPIKISVATLACVGD